MMMTDEVKEWTITVDRAGDKVTLTAVGVRHLGGGTVTTILTMEPWKAHGLADVLHAIARSIENGGGATHGEIRSAEVQR